MFPFALDRGKRRGSLVSLLGCGALGPGPSAPAGKLWLAIKVAVFVVTFLLVLLLNARVASAAEAGASKAGPAAELSRDSLDRLTYLELARVLADHWQKRPGSASEASGPAADPQAIRSMLFDLAIACAAMAGSSEDPRRRLEAISRELFERRGFRPLPAPEGGYGPEHLLLDEVLPRRAGSPLAIALVYCAIAELLSPPLDLRAVAWPAGAAARHQDGDLALSAVIAPGESGDVLGDDRLRARQAAGDSRPARERAPAAHSRAELAGLLLGELGRAARQRGETPAARHLLSRAVTLTPRSAELWLDLAHLAQRLGDPRGLREALDGALAADPGNARALVRRAVLLRAAGDLDGAERDLVKAQSVDLTADPVVHLELGDIERERGRHDRAIEAYRRALSGELTPVDRERVLSEIRELEVRPAVETLRGPSGYAAKFEALRRVAESPTPRATEALIEALRDPNLRFARLAWRTLRDITGETHGFEVEAWERWWAGGQAGARRSAGPQS